MIRLVRAELYKLRTTPGAWVCIVVTCALTALWIITAFVVRSHHHIVHFGAPTTTQGLRDLVGAGYVAGEVMAPVLGVLCITTEYRQKVITTTLLVNPRRPEVVTAKAVASVVWAVIMCLASFAIVAAMGIPLMVSQGGSLSAMWQQVGPVAPGLFGAYALLAVYGLGLGTLLRNQIASVVAAVGFSVILEPLIVVLFSSLAHMDVNFLPSRATQAVAGGLVPRGSGGAFATASTVLLSWWLGALVLIGWGVGLAIVGYWTTFRRDVT